MYLDCVIKDKKGHYENYYSAQNIVVLLILMDRDGRPSSEDTGKD